MEPVLKSFDFFTLGIQQQSNDFAKFAMDKNVGIIVLLMSHEAIPSLFYSNDVLLKGR